MQEMITDKFSYPKWQECLRKSGISDTRIFTATEDVAENQIPVILNGVSAATSLTMTQVMEAFGDYWSTIYAPNIYSFYFEKAKSTREMLINLDHIHVTMTQAISSAHPPRFRYEWLGEDHLIMHYESSRGLVALMPGLIRGLGKYYKDNPMVSVMGNAVHIHFA
jgi:hypothetical protein